MIYYIKKNNFKVLITLFSFVFSLLAKADEKTIKLASPDGNLHTVITVDNKISYQLYFKNQSVVKPSAISMTFDQVRIGKQPKIKRVKSEKVREVIKPLYGQFSELSNNYNQTEIIFNGNYRLVLRAYNEGFAYRFVTTIKDSVKVINEEVSFNLTGNPSSYFPETDNFTVWEMPYVKYNSLTAIADKKKAVTPVLFSNPQNGIKVVIAESDVLDYPGMYVSKDGTSLHGLWAPYPERTELGSWGNFVSVVKERRNYIAKTTGKRAFPWRMMIVTDDDRELLTSQLVYKLASDQKIKNTNWIKPGKATWEWWHDARLPGVAMPSGMDNRNTSLYKYYVDFASQNHLEYLMVDAGWSDNYNLRKPRDNSGLNIHEVIDYAQDKNVGVFLWCVATTLLKDLDSNLDYIRSLGAKGIKVDFFDRDDQQAMQWYEMIAKAAAKRQLMVNFHGCSKPTGLERSYPNIVNYEAVRGEESAKWDYTITPDHDVILPFTRLIAGPMDYTPGSMRNVSKADFKPIDPGLPLTMGTRCHELSKFVIYSQPFAMLSDSPAEYNKYPDVLKFLSVVPTTFNNTQVLDAKLGEYILMAKRKGKNWFVGAMTNWNSRNLNLDFSFLPDDQIYTAEVFTDAQDANENASNYQCQILKVKKDSKMPLWLAQGGGAVIFIHL